MLILHETYDHWSVAVLTVTVHSSFFPTFDFLKKYVAFCTGFNLLTTIFMLPYIIMDLPISGYNEQNTNEKFINLAVKKKDHAYLKIMEKRNNKKLFKNSVLLQNMNHLVQI